MNKQIVLMDSARMQRALKRMAIQVWEKLQPQQQLIVIGLNERGFATAGKLAANLEELLQTSVPVHRYDVSASPNQTSLPDCNDKLVLLVDDVIFSGKTMFDALSDICNLYEPQSIELAVLIDRGHRKYPLQTSMTGISVPTKLGEHIEVMLVNNALSEAILFKNKSTTD